MNRPLVKQSNLEFEMQLWNQDEDYIDIILGINGELKRSSEIKFNTNWKWFFSNSSEKNLNKSFKYTYLMGRINLEDLNIIEYIIYDEIEYIKDNFLNPSDLLFDFYIQKKYTSLSVNLHSRVHDFTTLKGMFIRQCAIEENNFLELINTVGILDKGPLGRYNKSVNISQVDAFLHSFEKFSNQCYFSLVYILNHNINLFLELLTNPLVSEFCFRDSDSMKEHFSNDVNRIANVAINVNHRL